MNLMQAIKEAVGYIDPAQEWLDNLELNESNRYYIYEFFLFGIRREGYGKLSDDKKFITVVFHQNLNKWAIIKEGVSAKTLFKSKRLEKYLFEHALNQNIRNV